MRKNLYYIFVFSIILFSCKENSTEPSVQNYQWNVSTPESRNMNSKMLDSASFYARKLEFVDGLVVIKDGYLVYEKYYNGFSENSPHYIWSCTKSFLSAVVGIAIQDGIIESLDKKVMDYFSEYTFAGLDQRFYNVTIRHLLTMTMGIDKEENVMLPVLQNDDWIRETLKLPLIYDPGTRFSYNSLQQHLISVIIAKKSGMDLLNYSRTFLTPKMGIEITDWDRDRKGNNIGGYGIWMTPRNMAVLGLLYLNNGKLNNEQIIPSEWVQASLTKTWKTDGKEWGPLRDYNYGYLWWLGKMNGYNLFMALGMGGQYIITFPELNLIVVTTAIKDISWDNNQELPILELISKYVLTAVGK